ncbi:acid protease [Microthyrium microscopicum]|uniref:Acid protease n=1 Tax=Microthyrium microscopicum TaxID=703497 RepID=A0A6A6U6D2_9PEZI|nr:acid protease [Microthyrium microscopicum]
MFWSLLSLLLSCDIVVAAEQRRALGVANLDVQSPRGFSAIQPGRKTQRQLFKSRQQKRYNSRDLITGSGTVQLDLVWDKRYQQYVTDLSFGTPPQNISFAVMMNQGDTVLNPSNSPSCLAQNGGCAGYGTFSPNASTTYSRLSSDFNLTAFSQWAIGDYATDTAWIGNDTIRGLQFGVSYNSTYPFSLLGLGFSIEEMQVVQLHEQPYVNFPQALANSGIINANAYSIWLNRGSLTGSVLLLGGVDSDKYTGELRTIPILPITASRQSVTIPLTDLRFGNTPVMNGGWNMSVVVDLGFTQTWLPSNLTNVLFPLVSGLYTPSDGVTRIFCSQSTNNTLLQLTTSWPQWTVQMSELVAVNPTNSSECIFGIQNADAVDLAYPYTLGLSVLKSIYMVLDLANAELSIAPSLSNVTSSKIAQINSGIAGVPGAIRAPTSTSASHGLSAGAKAGIAVGVIVAAGLLALCAFLILRRRRRRQALAKRKEEASKPDIHEKPELKGDSPLSPAEKLAKLHSGASEAPNTEIFEAEGDGDKIHEAKGNEIFEAQGGDEKMAVELPGAEVAEMESEPLAVELEDTSSRWRLYKKELN